MIPFGDNKISKNRTINRRMFILGAAKIIFLTAIVGRLFSLQILESSKYKYLSDKNRLREWKIPPQRGIIEDYFGNVIAANNQVYQLHIIPEQVENFNYLILRLKNTINFNDKQIKAIYKKKSKLIQSNFRSFYYTTFVGFFLIFILKGLSMRFTLPCLCIPQ